MNLNPKEMFVLSKSLTFNSFYRSGNVFCFFLAKKMIECSPKLQHDPVLYYDKNNRQVANIRNPYDAISSTIIKRRGSLKVNNPQRNDDIGIENEINSLSDEYLNYLQSTKENIDHLYIGHFETMIKDPYTNMKKIAYFFNLKLYKHIEEIESFDFLYEEIKKEMFNSEGPVGAEHLMTPHDGHMPREKTEGRLIVEEYVKNHNRLNQCYDLYMSMPYTTV